MSFARLDHLSEIAPLVDGAFNRPKFSPDFTEAAFEREYATVHKQVFDCFQRAETAMADLAEEAFSMGEPFSRDRAVIVVVTYIGLLSTELLHQLQQTLAEVSEDYRIIIDGSDQNGQQYYITITKQDTIAYAHNPKSLSQLGFDSTNA